MQAKLTNFPKFLRSSFIYLSKYYPLLPSPQLINGDAALKMNFNILNRESKAPKKNKTEQTLIRIP